MHASPFALLFLLLHSSLQQSGNFPEESDEEEPENETEFDFDCFSKIPIDDVRLFCNATKLPPWKMKDVGFDAQEVKNSAEARTSWKSYECEGPYGEKKKNEPRGSHRRKSPKFRREDTHFVVRLDLAIYNVCMVWEKLPRCKQCKGFDLRKIAIPDSPTNITIRYNGAAKEYRFNISANYETFDFLRNEVYYQLVLRKEGTLWPDCNDETQKRERYKVCLSKIGDNVDVPRSNLEYSTTYEARVRSIPKGGFFAGFWSPWSPIATFTTEEADFDVTAYLAWYISVSFFLVITVILISVYWNRFKPFIWPEIPDHKKTLEKLCNKPKQNFHLSFNPDYYEIMPINKIDYIKAREIPEDDHDIGTTDSSMGKSAIDACHTNLSPAEGSRGPPINTNNSGQCKNLEDKGENTLENPLDFVPITLLPNDDASEKCNSSTGSHGIMSLAIKHPVNGLRGLCWEDIYIAMPAFKTPSSAVKQVPKNTF